jgi:hypothetical protein
MKLKRRAAPRRAALALFATVAAAGPMTAAWAQDKYPSPSR